MTPEDLLAVGRITKAHGIGGEVSVYLLTEVEARFSPGSTLRLEDGRTLTVERARPHQHRLLVKFAEIVDRTGAEGLRGRVLVSPARDAPALEEPDRFWVHQVVGLEMVTEDDRPLGRIREVRANPANDIWVLEDGTMIPAVREFVKDVDLSSRRVVIRELPGLLGEQ